MKKMMILLGILMCMALPCSCADVPDEVKADMSSYRGGGESESENDTGFTYVKVAELSENAEKALSKEYGQFKISDKIRFEAPSEIYRMSFQNLSGFSVNSEKAAAELFYSPSELDLQKLEERDDGLMFYDEDKKQYICALEDGFIAMLKPEAFDISFSCNEPNVKIYHADRGDDLSDVYQLADGKCSVGDAVDYINGWLEENYRQFSPEFDHKVKTVIVREHEGNYLYQFLAEGIYKGVPLDSYTSKSAEEIVNGQYTVKMSYWYYHISIQMINTGEIASFTNGGGIYKPAETERIDECISMESALELCKRTFTDFKDVTFSDIDIMYTLEPVYEYDDEGIPENVIRYDSRPVWEIIIDVPPEDFLAAGEVNTYGDIRKYIYVDMVTGEIEYDFEISYRY